LSLDLNNKESVLLSREKIVHKIETEAYGAKLHHWRESGLQSRSFYT